MWGCQNENSGSKMKLPLISPAMLSGTLSWVQPVFVPVTAAGTRITFSTDAHSNNSLKKKEHSTTLTYLYNNQAFSWVFLEIISNWDISGHGFFKTGKKMNL